MNRHCSRWISSGSAKKLPRSLGERMAPAAPELNGCWRLLRCASKPLIEAWTARARVGSVASTRIEISAPRPR